MVDASPVGASPSGGAVAEGVRDESDELEALQAGLRDLNAQRAQLQTAHRQLRSQYSAAEAMSEQQGADFEAQQQQLRASMRDLSLNIRLKEELIRELVRSEQAPRVTSPRSRRDLAAIS